MAGDWVAMRTDLERDPAVFHIARRLKCSRREAVGHLHACWSFFDGMSRDGHAHSVTSADLDAVIGVRGFAAAMQTTPESSWLQVAEDGHIVMPNYDVWLSQSAKRRLLAAKRKRLQRERDGAGSVTLESRSRRDKNATTGQDRRDTTACAARAAPARGKAKEQPDEGKPPTAHQAAIDFWCAAYQRTRGSAYVFSGDKDGAIVKALLKAASLDAFKARATALLEHPDPFYAGADLGTLRSAWNKLAAAKPPTPSYMRPAEPEPNGHKADPAIARKAIREALAAAGIRKNP